MSESDGWRQQDWRGPILAIAAWAGTWAGTSDLTILAGGLILLGIAAAAWSAWNRRWLSVAAAITVLTAVGLGWSRAAAITDSPVADLAGRGAVATIEAQVGEGRFVNAAHGAPSWTTPAILVSLDARGQRWTSRLPIRISAAGDLAASWSTVPAGATTRALVRLGSASPGEPLAAWASARGSPELLLPPGPVDAAVSRVRQGLRDSVAGLPVEPRGLVPALVVGDTGGMTSALTEQFRITGLTHLVAVSGANLTILLAFVLWLGGRLGVLGWWRRGLAVAVVVAFVQLCRAEPSVLRAAAMGVVGLAALGWGGTRQGLRYLSWAVIGLLLIDPWLCRSAGFALSVCACAGIVIWAQRWATILAAWMPGWLAEGITVPVAAQLATQPIVTAISGQVSLIGIAANLLAAPLVGPATILGFLAAGVSVLWLSAAQLLGWAAGGFAQALCWIAGAGSALPGAAIGWPQHPAMVAALTIGCAALLIGLPMLWRRPWLVAAVTLAMIATTLQPVTVPGWPPAEWEVVSCDVGQGDATVINAGRGRAILIDTGPDERRVDRCLDQLGVTEVSWLFLTHLHADHAGGIAGVLSNRQLGQVLFSGVTRPTAGWRKVRTVVDQQPQVAQPGLVVAVGDVRVAVLAARPLAEDAPSSEEDSAAENDSSLVLRVTTPGLTILLAGDLEEAGQSNALAAVPDLSAQVLLVPHHGSAHQSADFLAAVGARVALVSVGEDNDYGHPAERTINTVAATGAQLYRTDRNGAIAISRDGDQLIVTTQRAG